MLNKRQIIIISAVAHSLSDFGTHPQIVHMVKCERAFLHRRISIRAVSVFELVPPLDAKRVIARQKSKYQKNQNRQNNNTFYALINLYDCRAFNKAQFMCGYWVSFTLSFLLSLTFTHTHPLSITCLCLCLLKQMEIYGCRVFASIAFALMHYNMWFERFLQLSGNIYKCVVSFAKVAPVLFSKAKTTNNLVSPRISALQR